MYTYRYTTHICISVSLSLYIYIYIHIHTCVLFVDMCTRVCVYARSATETIPRSQPMIPNPESQRQGGTEYILV